MTGCGGRLREAGDTPQPDVINCFDKKERMLLNFGHTLGHAIEAKYINKIYHGEAVGYGMLPFIDNLNLRSQVQTILQKMNINIDEARYHNLKEYIEKNNKNNFEKDKLYVNVIKLKDIGNPYIEKIDIEQFN